MGKASSAKKVARAARAGGRSAGTRQRNLLFPGAIAAIVLLGGGLITYAASDRKNDDSVAPVIFEDHWHSAFGVYVCDEFQPAIPEFESPDGIHTHSDNVIHIHPFSANAAGENATLGVYLDGAGIEVSSDELTVNGETYTEGEDTCGENEEEGQVVLAQWKDVQTTDANPARIETGIDDVRFREDGEGYVLAFVPEDADIPKPESAADLETLGAADAGVEASTTTTTTAGEGEGSSTTAGEPAAGSAPTAGDTTTTTGG